MIDRVRDAGIFSYRLVGEIDRTVLANSYVLQQCIAFDCVPDIGFALLVEVDHFGVAAAFEIENAFVVPAVLIVADQQALRVGRQGRLAGARQSEKYGGVLTLFVGVGRAVHRSHPLQRQEVVHVREHTLLHFASVPGIEDNLHLFGQVEHDRGLRIQAQFLVVLHLRFRCVQHYEIGFPVVFQLFGGRTDEHVGHEMSLPSHFHNEADFQTRVLISSAKGIHDEQALVRQFLVGQLLERLPALLADGLVVVLVLVRSPPDRIFGGIVQHEEFIFGRTAGINAGHHVHGAHVGNGALLETFQARFGLFLEQLVVRGIVYDLGHTRDAVLAQINCHSFLFFS